MEDFFIIFQVKCYTIFDAHTKTKSIHVATEYRRIKYSLQIYKCHSYLRYLFI